MNKITKNLSLFMMLGVLTMSGCGNKPTPIVINSDVNSVIEAIDKLENYDTNRIEEYLNVLSNAFYSLSIEDKNLVTNYEKLFQYQKSFFTKNGLPKGEFDETNIVSRFGVMSDVHASNNIPTALEIMQSFGDKKGLDGIIVSGDMTDGVVYYHTADWEIEKVKNMFLNNIPNDMPIVMTLGNHDTSNESNVTLFYDELGPRFFSNVVDLDNARNHGCSHSVVKGHHFICLECDYSTVTNEGLTPYAETYLKQTMKEITTSSDYKGEFIFVVTHLLPYQSTYDNSNSRKINDILKFYPQAVVIAGHTHTTVHDELNIDQNRFTTFNPGSVQWLFSGKNYYGVESSGVIKGVGYDSYSLPNGIIMELDNKGNMRLLRLDLRNDGYLIGEPWVVSAPKKNNSHLFSYTKDRMNAPYNSLPYFEDNFSSSLTYKQDASKKYDCTVSFTAAKDDGFIFSYHVVLKTITEKTLLDVNCLSEYFLYANRSKMPKEMTITFKGLSEVPSKISVVATDNMRAIGKNVTAIISVKK